MTISALETSISLSDTQSHADRKQDGGEGRGVGYAAVLRMYTFIKISCRAQHEIGI